MILDFKLGPLYNRVFDPLSRQPKNVFKYIKTKFSYSLGWTDSGGAPLRVWHRTVKSQAGQAAQ